MRIYLYAFLLSIIVVSCQSEPAVSEEINKETITIPDTCICDDLILDDKFKHFYYYKQERTEPFTGVCYTLYEDSEQKKMIKQLVGGKVEGKVVEFYSDGALQAEYWFNERHVYDSLKRYFPSGKVKYHAVYQYGQIKDILVNELKDSTALL